VSAGAAILTSPVIGPDGAIYVGLSDNTLAAVTRDGVKWKFSVGDQILAAPSLAADGTIYFGANDNQFYAVKPDGTRKWQLDVHVGIVSTPAVRGDGTIISAQTIISCTLSIPTAVRSGPRSKRMTSSNPRR